MEYKIRYILHTIKKWRDNICFKIISKCCPIDHNKVIFSSFIGKSYSDNPRAISEKLHEMYPNYKIVWQFADIKSKRKIVPPYVMCVRNGSFMALYQQYTAMVWVDNYCKSPETNKRQGQYYIQTWHGDRGLKKVLADMYIDKSKCVIYESNYCDLAISGSVFGEKVYHSSFIYGGEILKSGCPRNDILVNGDDSAAADVRKFYKIPEHMKILLYAPTFRDTNQSNKQSSRNLNFDEILTALEQQTGNTWCLLVRGHTGRHLEIGYKGSHLMVDATNYEDAKYILLASDAVISDYSSVATDFAILLRPIFLYVDDIKDYETNCRSLWYPMNKTPFWHAKSQAELIRLIRQYTPEKARQNCRDILNFYETYETGKSSEEVCKYIIKNNLSIVTEEL